MRNILDKIRRAIVRLLYPVRGESKNLIVELSEACEELLWHFENNCTWRSNDRDAERGHAALNKARIAVARAKRKKK